MVLSINLSKKFPKQILGTLIIEPGAARQVAKMLSSVVSAPPPFSDNSFKGSGPDLIGVYFLNKGKSGWNKSLLIKCWNWFSFFLELLMFEVLSERFFFLLGWLRSLFYWRDSSLWRICAKNVNIEALLEKIELLGKEKVLGEDRFQKSYISSSWDLMGCGGWLPREGQGFKAGSEQWITQTVQQRILMSFLLVCRHCHSS